MSQGKVGDQMVISLSQDAEQDDQLYQMVAEQFGEDNEWAIECRQEWIIVTCKQVVLPEQGWKLHISAGLSSAEEILSRVLPVLHGQGVCFKLAASLKRLRMLNHGFAGISQVGKFVTIYPEHEEQAIKLSVILDECTRGLRGPVVPSDRLLHAESLVSYRYGSFVSRLMYTPAGKVVPAMTTPAGELVPDVRERRYQAPDWVQDPFVGAGVAVEQEAVRSVLIGGRYVPLFTLYISARGGVMLGVDTFDGRSCMLKFARPNAYLDRDGRDARDILRYEAEMLQRLSDDPAFPLFFDLLEQDGTLYMVMQELSGETLGAYVEHAQGGLPIEQTLNWIRELATILERLHARGLIYRDLKPANVLVGADQRLWLIDCELMVEQGHRHAKRDIGTRGYMSVQHQAGAAAEVVDDVYSLGALFYYLLGGANPSLAPDANNLLQRPLQLLNPGVDRRIVRIVERCLEVDPRRRFASMAQVREALEDVVAPIVEEPERSVEVRPEHYFSLAKRVGDTLAKTAVRQPERAGVCWLSTVQFAGGRPLRALNCGCAGTILALAELVGVVDSQEQRALLQEGVQWLLHTETLIASPVAGLYVGEAGVGAALLRAGQVLGDRDIIDAAAEKSRWVARQPYSCQDMMSGAAGRLRFHLLLWEETREPEHLQAALAAGNWLASVAEDAGDAMVCWTLPADFTAMTYVGYAHGAAGIADALLDLFEVSGDERFIAPITGVVRLLERLAVPVLPDQINWPLYVRDQKHEMAGVYWCHGATGIGTFLLHAAQHECVDQELVRKAARTVALGSRRLGPTLCHGLAGSIDFLLDMFQWTGEQHFRSEALTLADLLEVFAREQEGQLLWPSDEPDCISPDYLVGYAGVLPSLLRLAEPERRPRQLSRRGFRYMGEKTQSAFC